MHPSEPDTSAESVVESSGGRTTMNGKPVLFRPTKTVLNMHSGFEKKLLCDGPTFSLGDACAYSCSFCYVPDMMRKAAYVPKDHPHKDMVVRRENALPILRKQLHSLKPEVRDQHLVIYSSPLVDIAANMDLLRETADACVWILRYTQWHIRLLSKSNLLPKLAHEIIDASQATGWENAVRSRMIFGVSTGTLDDAQAAAFETGCPKVSKRIQSLHQLQDEGFRTFGMICPSLPQKESTYAKWSFDIMKAIRAEKCEHVWAEVINVRGDSMTRTCKALHTAGYEWQASELAQCATSKSCWEHHARHTFLNHAAVMDILHPAKSKSLRFLQYVTKSTRAWWDDAGPGSVLL